MSALFRLDDDPILAATAPDDETLRRALPDAARVLGAAVRLRAGPLEAAGLAPPWRCEAQAAAVVWVASSAAAYRWACIYGGVLAAEHSHRFLEVSPHQHEVAWASTYARWFPLHPADTPPPPSPGAQRPGEGCVEAWRRSLIESLRGGQPTWTRRTPPEWYVGRAP